jgi:hypothetical protein
MDYISESVANYVLSEDIEPININQEFIQFREKLERELSFSKKKIQKLEHEIFIENERSIYLDSKIKEINELLKPIPQKSIDVPEKEKSDLPSISAEFITAIIVLLTREGPTQLSNIPHKLPQNVLPPKGVKGLFTKWMEQVPNLQIDIQNDTDSKGGRRQLRIYSIKQVEKESTKVCFQKARGKPCKKLNDKGLCKYCN